MRYTVLWLALAVVACHNSKLDSEVRKNLLESQNEKQDASNDSDEVAVEPTSVGGAFLICADDLSLNPSTSQFGCRIEDERGEKMSRFQPKDSDIVAVRLESAITGKAIYESNAFWHWTFEYQKAERADYRIKFVGDLPQLSQREVKVLDQHPAYPKPATPGAPAPASTPTSSPEASHIMFVTSQSYRPGGTAALQFDSLQAADAICNLHANAAKLPGSFRAVLSDSTAEARNRIVLNGPIKLTNGSTIANKNVFWSASHSLPTLLDETAKAIGGGSVKVWSGTLETGGTNIGQTCNDWRDSSNAAKGVYGLADKADAWINDGQESCDKDLRLYCIN